MKRSFIHSIPVLKYLLPLFLVFIVTYVKLQLSQLLGVATPFLLYPGIIIFAACYCGKYPALLIVVVTTFLSNYFFLAPYREFSFTEAAIAQSLVFFIESTVIAWISIAFINAYNELERQRGRFRALIEKSSDAIIMYDAKGDIIYCTNAVFSILGYTCEEYVKLTNRELMYPEEYELYQQNLIALLAKETGAYVKVKHRTKHKDGSWVWIESTLTNLVDDSSVRAIVCNFRDISAQVEAIQQKNSFIGIASHELKTPVTSLKMYAQVLNKKIEGTHDQQLKTLSKHLDKIVDRISSLVVDLLDVTRLNNAKLILSLKQFNINDLLVEVTEQLQLTAPKHHLILHTQGLSLVRGDETRIRQVIINLINNAIKYSPDANEVIINSFNHNNDYIEIRVKDFGMGIAVQHKEKIFERFYRIGKQETDTISGIGLGLFISAEIIRAHGGEIGFESEPGKGSEFWFKLPVRGSTISY